MLYTKHREPKLKSFCEARSELNAAHPSEKSRVSRSSVHVGQSTRISAAAVATVFAFWRWNRPFVSVCCSCRIIAVAPRFLRAVICNLCNTWKSDDATIITHALIRYYLLRVTIRSSLFCMDMIKTRLRTEIAFHNGRWFIINEFTKRFVASKFLITFHWDKLYLPIPDWLVCYRLSIHYRAPFVQWIRIDSANYFLAAT